MPVTRFKRRDLERLIGKSSGKEGLCPTCMKPYSPATHLTHETCDVVDDLIETLLHVDKALKGLTKVTPSMVVHNPSTCMKANAKHGSCDICKVLMLK